MFLIISINVLSSFYSRCRRPALPRPVEHEHEPRSLESEHLRFRWLSTRVHDLPKPSPRIRSTAGGPTDRHVITTGPRTRHDFFIAPSIAPSSAPRPHLSPRSLAGQATTTTTTTTTTSHHTKRAPTPNRASTNLPSSIRTGSSTFSNHAPPTPSPLPTRLSGWFSHTFGTSTTELSLPFLLASTSSASFTPRDMSPGTSPKRSVGASALLAAAKHGKGHLGSIFWIATPCQTGALIQYGSLASSIQAGSLLLRPLLPPRLRPNRSVRPSRPPQTRGATQNQASSSGHLFFTPISLPAYG
ncbi:hypothetical protein C0995_012251 [Termitomyces sp. Mi166|nr:hypothetical protein C0995_012251 [Termitomyces sp. Mi166\